MSDASSKPRLIVLTKAATLPSGHKLEVTGRKVLVNVADVVVCEQEVEGYTRIIFRERVNYTLVEETPEEIYKLIYWDGQPLLPGSP